MGVTTYADAIEGKFLNRDLTGELENPKNKILGGTVEGNFFWDARIGEGSKLFHSGVRQMDHRILGFDILNYQNACYLLAQQLRNFFIELYVNIYYSDSHNKGIRQFVS